MSPYLQRSALYPPQIPEVPASDLCLIVVIPAYVEDQLIRSLQSLYDCRRPSGSCEVIVVINDSEKDEPSICRKNREIYQEAQNWALQHSEETLRFFILHHSGLPAKTAGVGLARKIGMDEAVYRFERSGNRRGIIACYDADSLCQDNYLLELERYFADNPKMQACSIYFEHPLEGSKYPENIYRAITSYELHLRYYIQAQRWAGFPFAFHTIGSSMAVRSDAYQQQGGMSRRQAGEDFYFLHKFTPLDHFGELKTTTVYPSPRISDRVPFGTGKSIKEILVIQQAFQTYSPKTFEALKSFLDKIPEFYESTELSRQLNALPPAIRHFLQEAGFEKKLEEIRQNTAGPGPFIKRFYRWFNAFQLMKYVHFVRDRYYPKVPVLEAGNDLLKKMGNRPELDEKMCLLRLREIERC